jgi:hypothetical protein
VLVKLLKFVVRTRFSRPFLIFIAAAVIYSAAISRASPPSAVTTIFAYYSVGFVAIFLAMSLATGGVMVMKSDRDYLFTLPLTARDLSLAIFVSQFIAFGVAVLLTSVFLTQSITSPLFLVDLLALAMITTALSIIALSLQTRIRLGLAVGLALWALLAFVGVPFTPASAFNGNLYGGTATLVALAALTTTAAFRGLSRVEVDMMKSITKTSSSEVKSPNSFIGRSPLNAIYLMNLSTMAFAGRMNMGGVSRYTSRRVKTKWILVATSVAAAAYLSTVVLIGHRIAENASSVPAEIGVAVGLSFMAFFLSQSAISDERIWLSLSSLPAASYFRHLMASRVLSLLLILTPFAVADAALALLGYWGAVGALAVTVAVIPSTFVLQICWAAYIAPVQVKEEDITMPAQFNLRQMAAALPLGATFLLVTAASVFPLVAAVAGLALSALAGLLTLSGGFWSRVVTRLTESGFV